MTNPEAAPATTKAGRNEQRKLLATLLNALCAALLITALVQPALAVLSAAGELTLRAFLAALLFLALAPILHVVARRVVAKLED